ncbi:MAG TPA: hypothetical protein VEC99_07465 [Clostridia bacterium]|nr:hypothetical protein [Clostridia bacterium]
MQTSNSLKKIVAHPCFAVAAVLAMSFILPRFGTVAMMVGCATVVSVYVAALPESFRSRSGSLRMAVCLVAAMWLGAAVVTTLTLMGEITN